MCTRQPNKPNDDVPPTPTMPSASPSPQVLEWQRNPSIKHADSIDVELASLDNNASHHKLDQQKRRRKCMLVACGLLFVAAAIGVAIGVASSVTSSKPLVVPEVSAALPSTPVDGVQHNRQYINPLPTPLSFSLLGCNMCAVCYALHRGSAPPSLPQVVPAMAPQTCQAASARR